MGLTRQLAEFVAGIDAGALPHACLASVRRGIADAVGVALAGAREPVVGHALALLAAPAADGPSRIWTHPLHAAPAEAALLNATAAHALDFDDTGLDGHPSAVLAPVVLAQAQASGLCWRDAVVGYVAGYETWAELIGRDLDKHHAKGWHPSAVFGVVAGAAAAARLRRLPAATTAHALGIAASMAAGLVANFGSMTKPLQLGLAARNAVLAAALAERGVDAAGDALESPRGLLAALSPAGRVRLDGACRVGRDWRILRQPPNIKRYPTCYATHRIIDAALSLQPRLGRGAQDIEEVVVEIGELQAAMLRCPRPTSALDARFSAQYAVACALARGHVELRDLHEPSVRQADVQQLLGKVRVVTLAARDPLEPLFSPEDRVRVRLAGGAPPLCAAVQRPLGHASRPLGEGALRDKFLGCAGIHLGAAEALAWWDSATAPLQQPVRWPEARG